MRTRTLRGAANSAASILLAFALASSPSSANEPRLLRPWPAGMAAPQLKLDDAAGKHWQLAALRGKVVVLNFWASWCGPCVEELPVFNKLAEQSNGKLVVLGINYKEPSWTVERFTREHQFAYPVLLDKNGEHFERWTDGVMPTTILIDRDGKPRWRMIGAISANDATFRAAIDKLLAQ
jgi:thiol-disulfide isomerase/thioredoxin